LRSFISLLGVGTVREATGSLVGWLRPLSGFVL
jgi:hypothetical protein